jgi:hypothetical protein
MTRRPGPAPSRPDTAGKPRRAAPWTLTDQDRAAIRAAVAALPPLTDEQVDALCDVIIAARKRWQREDAAPDPTSPAEQVPRGLRAAPAPQ